MIFPMSSKSELTQVQSGDLTHYGVKNIQKLNNDQK